jgi:hypothetical protein
LVFLKGILKKWHVYQVFTDCFPEGAGIKRERKFENVISTDTRWYLFRYIMGGSGENEARTEGRAVFLTP